MSMDEARSFLALRLPWMLRWRGSSRFVGVPCLLPECRKNVARTSRGRQAWFCCPSHRDTAQARREALTAEIEAIEQLLLVDRRAAYGQDRRAREADLRYLRQVLLLTYPRPGDKVS